MDQATQLRKLVEAGRKTALTIAVLSGKGGVGKSNVAVNLAVCLSARGMRTTVVDLDLGLANTDLLLGIQPRYTIAHCLSGARSVESICVDGPGGVRVLAGASGLEGLADLSTFERRRLLTQLHKLETSTDIVVLDCAAGLSPSVVTFATSADRILLVTTPQPTALTDGYATIKALHRSGYRGRVEVFVNMVHSRREAETTFERLSDVSLKFMDYPLAWGGYMVHDTAVERAVLARSPFVIQSPSSNATACVAATAERIANGLGRPRRRGSFFRRVAGLFV